MFNAERLLGQLLSSGMGRGRSRKSALGGMSLGIGAIGVAIAAYEHFSQKKQVTPPTPQNTPTQAPPPMPPPLANQPTHIPEPPKQQDQAILLIQAMIAAAWADGTLDNAERSAIVKKAQTAQLNTSELEFLETQLQNPVSIDQLAAEAKSAQLEEATYSAAYLAIEVDNDQEQEFFNLLAQKLGLSETQIKLIHQQLGVTQ
ncbi:MAG: DUF533 domain-containing protein [bacterium]